MSRRNTTTERVGARFARRDDANLEIQTALMKRRCLDFEIRVIVGPAAGRPPTRPSWRRAVVAS
jgi:hypothetical protein